MALECSWHFRHFDRGSAVTPLVWYLMFYVAFATFPFLFFRRFRDTVLLFAVAAIAGPMHFFMIYRLVTAAFPNQVMGLLPAAFSIPLLLSFMTVLKRTPESSPARLAQLAWFGGTALFFITLVVPIQFERQWITIGWAMEGVALLWLFHRVPHPGLRVVGIVLLMAAFVRLALNPAVLAYQLRSSTPIFNWYLYSYGIVTACFAAATRLLAPPRNIVFQENVRPVMAGLGTILAFLLLNIEIADFYSPAGSSLRFQFSGNFARDMTYSISWALFALALLLFGIFRNNLASRYAGIGLLSATLLKLFFHDLARLDQLYRIAAFLGVAVVAILASFSYQRFYALRVEDDVTDREASGV